VGIATGELLFGRQTNDVVESGVSADRAEKSAGDSRRYSRFERKESDRFISFARKDMSGAD
jgi:hypothetical protein